MGERAFRHFVKNFKVWVYPNSVRSRRAKMEMWRAVRLQGFEETQINLNNVCGMAWNGTSTVITFVCGKEVYVDERPKDILDPRFGRGR
jgi:hypothetical protein